ncbi:MAG: protein YgfX [Pseudomonadota bacterium]
MSSSVFDRPLRLELKPSRYLYLLILIGYGGALLLLWLTPLWWPVKLLLTLALLGDGWRQVRRHVWYRHCAAIPALIWHEDGRWVVPGDGTREDSELTLKQSFVHPWLVVLNFAAGRWRTNSVVILPDALEHDTFRRLRVRLRMEGGSSAAQAP